MKFESAATHAPLRKTLLKSCFIALLSVKEYLKVRIHWCTFCYSILFNKTSILLSETLLCYSKHCFFKIKTAFSKPISFGLFHIMFYLDSFFSLNAYLLILTIQFGFYWFILLNKKKCVPVMPCTPLIYLKAKFEPPFS